MIGNHSDLYTQGHFAYDSHKGLGVTTSHLRFGEQKITSMYDITSADYIAVHHPSYLRKFDTLKTIKQGGTVVLNCAWTPEELNAELPESVKSQIAREGASLYTIDATKVAQDAGLGLRINMVMQSCFFHLSEVPNPTAL